MDGQTVASGVYSEVIALGVRFRSSGRVVDVRAPAGVCFDTRETPQSYHAYTRVPATPLQPHAVMPGVRPAPPPPPRGRAAPPAPPQQCRMCAPAPRPSARSAPPRIAPSARPSGRPAARRRLTSRVGGCEPEERESREAWKRHGKRRGLALRRHVRAACDDFHFSSSRYTVTLPLSMLWKTPRARTPRPAAGRIS